MHHACRDGGRTRAARKGGDFRVVRWWQPRTHGRSRSKDVIDEGLIHMSQKFDMKCCAEYEPVRCESGSVLEDRPAGHLASPVSPSPASATRPTVQRRSWLLATAWTPIVNLCTILRA